MPTERVFVDHQICDLSEQAGIDVVGFADDDAIAVIEAFQDDFECGLGIFGQAIEDLFKKSFCGGDIMVTPKPCVDIAIEDGVICVVENVDAVFKGGGVMIVPRQQFDAGVGLNNAVVFGHINVQMCALCFCESKGENVFETCVLQLGVFKEQETVVFEEEGVKDAVGPIEWVGRCVFEKDVGKAFCIGGRTHIVQVRKIVTLAGQFGLVEGGHIFVLIVSSKGKQDKKRNG